MKIIVVFNTYDSNLFLNSISGDASAYSIGGLNLKHQEVPPVPEPEMLAGIAFAGAIGWWLSRTRKVSAYSATL